MSSLYVVISHRQSGLFRRYPRGFAVPTGWRLVLEDEFLYIGGEAIIPYDEQGNLVEQLESVSRYGDE